MLPEHPWGSRRDELSVLEEEFDDLCHRHDRGKGRGGLEGTDAQAWEAEEAVLREQSDAEDASEAELTRRIGPGWLDTPDDCPHEGHAHDHAPHGPARDAGPARPLRDLLRADADRDPLYERALAVAASTYRWARAAYAQERHPLTYRACVNACLVPMKVSYALNELLFDDTYAADVAEKEIELAERYLGRSHASLRALLEEGALPEEQRGLLGAHEDLGRELTTFRARLGKDREGRIV